MKFFHVYNEQYLEGLEKNGLINEDSGFKIQHVFSLEEAMKFNRFAAKGSRLHNFLRENRFPFYVDRIAGGVTYHSYSFDPSLIEEYQSLLGDWFLGFQHHESASNRNLDWNRVRERMDGQTGPYDVELLKSRSLRSYAKTPDGKILYGFSQGSPEEYAARTYPETVAEWYAEMEWMYRERMKETRGKILPVDSFLLFTKMQNDLGMGAFVPEVGSQIGQMRVAVALARGMAKAYHKKWGVYYECWRNTPGLGATMPCFNRDPGNEWYLTQETHKDDFTSFGPNGGSSRLLQNRIYHYALMAGAEIFGEEWGLNCSYNDMSTFELSPYGICKKKFIDFSRKHRTVRAKIPFAIVLPCEFPCIFLGGREKSRPLGALRNDFRGRALDEGQQKRYGRIDDLLVAFLGRPDHVIVGNEGHVMHNGRYGDLFDLIYEDAPHEALDRYDALIDGTVGGSFAARMGNQYRILKSDDLELLEKEVQGLIDKILPCYADSLHWLLSEDENGRYISLFNNEGNERDIEKGDIIHPEADAAVTVTLREAGELRVVTKSCDAISVERLRNGKFCVRVPAAQFVILQY